MFAAVLLRKRSVLLGVLVACFAAAAGAQSNVPAPIITGNQGEPIKHVPDLVFKSSVRRVVVDVVVSDSFGKPVSGLTADDFTLAEDGKPQKIRFFDVHDFDPISDSLPKLPPLLPTNTFVNVPAGPERGPLYVLLLDLLNMEIADQPTARKQLMDFIRKKPEGTRFAVYVLTDHLFQVQGFTESRRLLEEAIDPYNPHSRLPKIFLYADNFRPYVSTPGVLGKIGEYLANLPGHKNLIWFSGSFPSTIMPSSDGKTEALSVSDLVKEATDILARARVAVYPVDVRGTVATSPGAGDSKAPGNSSGLEADAMVNAAYMTEEEIAHATGGRAYHSTNDLAGALSAATETGGRYYTLTYSPSNQNYDGTLRHVKVDLTKRGYRLEYRRSYFGNTDSRKMEPAREKTPITELEPMAVSKPSDSLYPNMQKGAPMAHQLLFRAYFHTLTPAASPTREQIKNLEDRPEAVRDRKKSAPVKAAHHVKLQTYQIDYTIAARYPLLEVAAAAYDDDGQILNASIQRVIEERMDVPAEKSDGAIYRVQQKFDVPVNASTVRVAVRDVATDNVGALEIKLPLAQEESAVGAPNVEESPSQKAAGTPKSP